MNGGRQMRYRPRLSEIPFLVTVCLSLPLVFLALQTGINLEASLSSEVHQSIDLKVGTFSRIKGSIKPVDCIDIIEKAQQNNTDANKNRLFLRYVDGNPRYWISLHAKGYDPVRWGVMDHGRYYEQVESQCFREILANSSRPRVIDVGGNIGWYTLLSAAMGARVDTFEPNPKNYLRMCESICVNKWIDGTCNELGDLTIRGSRQNGRVRIFPVGVGSAESSALFEAGLDSRNNPGAGAIVESKSVPKIALKKYLEITIMPLDEMARNLGWYDETIDIMKIDVEGYEIHVIRGAKALLKSNRIKNIFMEGDVSGPAKQKKFRELVKTFADAGYEVFKIGGYSGPSDTNVPPMDENIEQSLAQQCAGGDGQKRKKCNLWWKLPGA